MSARRSPLAKGWLHWGAGLVRGLRWPRGLSSKIYLAFLITSVVPTSIAGLIGILYSFDVLKQEMLLHLAQETAIRAEAQTNFFRQLSSELSYLANAPAVRDLPEGIGDTERSDPDGARRRIKRAFAAFAEAYPYIYQIRYLDGRGREVVRVDRRDDKIHDVPEPELQDKSDRYYVRDSMALEPGEIYVSPLDLNVEGGQVETPEKPVIRLATPVTDAAGRKRGLLIVNLHAGIILDQVQGMADARSGTAFLFNRSGYYLARSPAGSAEGGFRMQSIDDITAFPRPLLGKILEGDRNAELVGDWIIAYAPILVRSQATAGRDQPVEWAVMLAYPRDKLLAVVFSLSSLYTVLAVALAVTAIAGFLLSRHLLRPLLSLRDETEAIAQGDFSGRVEIKGQDEIALLGQRFNTMAEWLERYYGALEGQRQSLEIEVRARTAALERERANLAAILANTGDGILALSPDGIIEFANTAAALMFDSPAVALVGLPFQNLWSGWNDLASGSSPQLLTAQIGDRSLALNIAPLRVATEQHGFIIVLRDVSEERRLQDERRELDRQLFQMEKMTTMGELAMGLAHEIGNPLAGMKTVVQVLRSEELDADTTGRYLSRIEDEVNRLSSFLRTFHGFAAPQESFPRACTLDDVLDDVLLWTRKEASSQGITIEYRHCGKDIPKLWADLNQLKQVLLNLVINAIHATRGGGRITIGMCGAVRPEDRERPVQRMRFCIDDNGEGIAPEILPTIFDPFFTTRASGSGLGLAVVKKIVAQHGADIVVESTPGKGTRFTLVWPVAEDGSVAGTAADLNCLRKAAHG